jgi:hypothetical protein
MKTILISILVASVLTVASRAADGAGPTFLTKGHTYSVTYSETDENAVSSRLSRRVTIVEHAGASWYLVTSAGRPPFWLNFALVTTVSDTEQLSKPTAK